MRNRIFFLFSLFAITTLAGCAHPPEKHVNSPEVQRSHAEGAQGELSSEVRK